MDKRRIWLHCCFGIVHGWQGFVLNLDELQRLFGDFQTVCSDGCHRLAYVSHFIHGEDCLILNRTPNIHQRHVAGSNDGSDAWQVAGPACVKVPDSSVWFGAAEELTVKHTGQNEIYGIDGLAGHFGESVQSGQ